MVIFSYMIYKLCNNKGISSKFWIFRFISLSVGFELCIGLIFMSIYGMSFMEDVQKMIVVGGINILIITAIFFLVRKNISNMVDENDNDPDKDTTPEKDLSYFR